MKTRQYISLLLTLFLSLGAFAQNGNKLSIPELSALPGRTISLPVYVDNTAEIVALQFTLQVPAGSSLLPASVVLNPDRAIDHQVTLRHQGGQKYLCLIYSPSNSTLRGRAGKVLSVDLQVSNDYAVGSTHEFAFEDVVLSLRDGNNALSSIETGLLTMQRFPDLYVHDISADKTQYAPGEPMSITWQISNLGDVSSGAGWKEQLFLVQADGTETFIGATNYEETLGASAVVSRQATINLPSFVGVDGDVNVRIQVVPYSQTGENEATLGNNTGVSQKIVSISKQLTLTLQTGRIQETYSQPIRCTLSRSGNRTLEEVFTLTATADGRAAIPATVAIPAGSASTNFYIQLKDNQTLDEDSVVQITASGGTYTAVSARMVIEDNELPDLKLTASESLIHEGESVQLTVSLSRASTYPLDVMLYSENTSRFTFPSKVTMPAGQTTATIEVTAKDDDLPSLFLSNTFTAYAAGYNKAESIVVLEDDDIPALELTLTPNKVSESVGPVAVAATLRRTGVTNNKITVKLSDDSDGDINYGTSAIEMPKGVEEVHFNLGPKDNSKVDGDRVVNITAAVYISSCSCQAEGESAGVVSAPLTILDDDGPALTLKSSASTVKEGNKLTLTVSRNTATTEALTVTLSGDKDVMFETYNHTLTIPAGATSAAIELTSKSNDIQDDSFTAVFTATTEGYSTGTCWLMVTDQTLPDARIISITAEQTEVEVGGSTEISIAVTNEGAAVLPAGCIVSIYSTNAQIALRTTKDLEVGENEILSATFNLPEAICTNSYYAVVNGTNQVKELNYNNNTSSTIAVSTISPFTASVTTDKSIYRQGENVQITGLLTGSQIKEQTAEIYIINEGVRQTLTAVTDEKGNFSTTWTPYSSQSGHFIIGACFQGERKTTEMSSFDIYGFRRANNSWIICNVADCDPYQGEITITNPGDLNLHNLTVEVIDKPDAIKAEFSSVATLEGGQTAQIPFSLQSDVYSPNSGDYERVNIRIGSDEGASLVTSLLFYNQKSLPQLQASINNLKTTMSIEGGSDYTFNITNVGRNETGEITFDLPSWMTTVTPSRLPSLAQGEIATVILHLQPDETMKANIPIPSSYFGINPEKGNGIAINYDILPVSEKTGTLNVDVIDNATIYSPDRPHVGNANITISRLVTGETITQGVSNADGTFTTTLQEGYYNVQIAKNSHYDYEETIYVAPGTETNHDAFMTVRPITYDFNMVETTVADEYIIEPVVKYETRVYAPVVVVNYPELPYANHIAYITVTNKGLIAAKNVSIMLPENSDYMQFEQLGESTIASLAPEATHIFPVRVTVDQDYAYDTPQMTLSNSITYAEYEPVSGNEVQAQSNIRRKAETVIGRPNCFKKHFKARRQKFKCNKLTGEEEPDGYEDYDAVYYYGKCGNAPIITRTSTNGWFDGIAQTIVPAVPPVPSITGPTGKVTAHQTSTYLADRLRTILMTGCTNNCEDALIKALKDCFGVFKACKDAADPKENLEALSEMLSKEKLKDVSRCVTEHLLKDREKLVDCLKDWIENIPAIDCARKLSQCILDIQNAYYECEALHNYNKNTGRYIRSKQSKRNVEKTDEIEKNINVESLGVLAQEIALLCEFIEGGNIVTPELEQRAQELDEYCCSLGLSGLAEMNHISEEYDLYLDKRMEALEQSQSVCSTVTIKFDQSMIITRQAFKGFFTMENGNEEFAVTDLTLNLVITDDEGNRATAHEFQINMESLEGFSGELDMNSGWKLSPNGKGTATMTFLPTKYAAPTEPKDYSFGGTISYYDPFTGQMVTRDLYPVVMTVNPTPELDLTYFMQRDVYGDDPLTKDVVEQSEPAEFSLLINNIGYGDATNVRMVTNQPKIEDNEKGLLIDFEILSAQLNGGDKSPALGGSIPTDFGTIPAHSQAYAQWWLQSSLLGHFTDYDVQATHVTSYGNPDLSLLNEVTIHELIRSIKVDNGTVTGFMVNDLQDTEDTPDMVYFTDGTTAEVSVVASASIVEQSSTEYLLTITPSQSGWNYGHTTDPTYGRATLIGIRRQSDGKDINLRNFWQTDRTLRDGKAWLYENNLHFVDNMGQSTETYVLTFEPRPDVELQVASIEGIPEEGTVLREPQKNVIVTFNKDIDAETFTREDIILRCQGIRMEAPVTITPVSNRQFSLDLSSITLGNGRYVLEIQTAGINDMDGYSGTSGKTAAWIQFTEATTLALSFDEVEVVYGNSFKEPQIITNSTAIPAWSSKNPLVATIDSETGRVTVKAVGATRMSVNLEENITSDAISSSYLLTVLPPEGQSEAASDANPVQITIPEGKTMATFCCPMPIDFSGATDDCRAYIVSGIDGSTVEFEEVTETKGGVGLLMYGKSGTYTFPVRNSFNEPENELIGTLAPTYIERETDGRINLGLKGTKFVPINAGVLPANKAYLSTALQAGVKELSIVFRGADGISTTIQAESVQEWFDITGKKVNRPINKGIYINRGQKIIIK